MTGDIQAILLDPARLTALARSGLLDSPASESFDRLTRLARRFTGATQALITLIDADRQYIMSGEGLREPWASKRETPISHSFCQHMLRSGQPLIVEDARSDSRLKGSPAIVEMEFVAYAGVPLVTSAGLVLGALSVADPVPHPWDANHVATLEDLASIACAEIERRIVAHTVTHAPDAALPVPYQQIVAALEEGIVLCDANGIIIASNPGVERIMGVPAHEMIGHPVDSGEWHAIREDGTVFPMSEMPVWTALRTGKPKSNVIMGIPWRDGRLIWLSTSSQPVKLPGEDKPVAAVTSFVDITELRLAQDQLRTYADRLASLRQVDQAILAARSTSEIAAVVIERLRRLVRCDRATVAMIDIDENHVRILAAEGHGIGRLSAGTTIPLDTFGPNSEIMLRLARIPARIVDDVRGSTDNLWWSFIRSRGTRTYLHVRLETQGQTIGILFLECDQPSSFNLYDLDNAREVAGPLAVALAQARLWEALHEKERLQSLLLEQVIHAQEDERRRVARELHDDIGQSLTALTMRLGVVQETLPSPAKRSRSILEDTQTLASDMMAEIRRIIADLRPPVLDDLGLVPALQRLAADVNSRCNVAARVEVVALPGRLPPRVEIALFRIVQEALNNICKHARANTARILLNGASGRLILQVIDDGDGFDAGDGTTPFATAGDGLDHFGLLGMMERATLLGGLCTIRSTPGAGTTVRVELPLPAEPL